MHKTSAWPLSVVYADLVVYASLYSFVDWRDQGIAPWAFLSAPLPKYWTGFDVGINVLGYAPLGFLLALGVLRSRHSRSPVLLAVVAGSLLSLLMEMTQSYLPTRVPSNVDLALNAIGTGLGAALAAALEKAGAIDRWSRFRKRWFVADARGALVLLALWPVALMFPAAVPLGLGQVLERLVTFVADWLADTPFLAWLPLGAFELQPLLPDTELVCVALGLLVPCLLGFCVIRTGLQRAGFVLVALATGTASTALSAALSFGPENAWAWLDDPVQWGLAGSALLALALSRLPVRASAVLVVLSLMVWLWLLNQAPASPYFAQTLQTWEQGRFIRFNGLAQWLGWLWPYAVLAYALSRATEAGTKT